MNSSIHQAVLLNETIEGLNIQPNAWYIDATFGRGGHTQAILNKGANVVAFDVDQSAIDHGQTEMSEEIESGKLILIRANFRELAQQLASLRPEVKQNIQGILFDFGTTVDQLKDTQRGFSFESDSELDMRMDDRLGVKAKDLLALIDENQLTLLFQEYGGEESSRAIAKAICTERQRHPITTTKQLVSIIERIKRNRGHLHPATKVFQALRIAVNSELENIREALPQAIEVLQQGGRLVTIAFHEGEDRIAKQSMKAWEEQNSGEQQTKKPIEASETELQTNPRARSAKLRIFIKK